VACPSQPGIIKRLFVKKRTMFSTRVILPEDLHEQLRIIAFERRVSMGAVIREALKKEFS